MEEENVPVITDRDELYDKCENMEQLFSNYYLPLLEVHYRKTYDLQRENKSLQSQLKAKEDNWNYIKKMLKEARNEEFNINGYCGTCTDVDIDFLLSKMEELEILSKGENK